MRQIGLIILLFFTSLAYAQNVEFKASAPSVVAVGEQFKLEYTLNKDCLLYTSDAADDV